MRSAPPLDAALVLAVLVGGMLGTAFRLGLDLAVPPADLPVSTLLVNTVGAFALGMLVAGVWPTAPAWLRAGLGVGLLGSFTTFSAVAVSVVALTEAGNLPLAVGYLVAELALGLGAALFGLRLGAGRTTVVSAPAADTAPAALSPADTPPADSGLR